MFLLHRPFLYLLRYAFFFHWECLKYIIFLNFLLVITGSFLQGFICLVNAELGGGGFASDSSFDDSTTLPHIC